MKQDWAKIAEQIKDEDLIKAALGETATYLELRKPFSNPHDFRHFLSEALAERLQKANEEIADLKERGDSFLTSF